MSKKNGWILPAALGALVLVLILVFCIPVRQPKFLEGAQQVFLQATDSLAVNGQPAFDTAKAELPSDEAAIEELAAIFRDYRLYRCLKYFDTLDGATTYHGSSTTVMISYLTGEKNDFHNISLYGKYLHFDDHLWRIGRNNSDWDELAQRLKDFILEYSEDKNTN